MRTDGDAIATTNLRSRSPSRSLMCVLHQSVNEVSSGDWQAIVDESSDLAMDRRLIAVQERTLHDQCRMWTAVVREQTGAGAVAGAQPVACACLCLFQVDSAISAHPFLQRAAAIARHVHSGALRFNVLFCGLPAPAGASHLRIAPGADRRAVMECLHRSMHELADRERAALIVFKEFGDESDDLARELARVGYECGNIPPMHRLTGSFRTFDEFLRSMRSRYRAQVQRSRKKIAANGFIIEHHAGGESIERTFTPLVHDLYLRVWERSAHKMERLPREFFVHAAHALKDDAALTIIRRSAGEAVGFTFSIASGRRWHNLYSGVDYSINGEGDILFNLFYADLAAALSRGCDEVLLGQTSDAFKQRLGSVIQPLQFCVRARSSLVHAGLRAFSPLVFPAPAPLRAAHVFRKVPERRPIILNTSPREVEHAASELTASGV